MAGGPEDHFTDNELYVLVEGDEWAHVEALDPDAGYWARRFAQLVNWRARGEKAVIEPSSLQRRNSQLKEIARLRAEGELTESELEAVKARLPRTKPRLTVRSWSDARNGRGAKALR
jgi:hypothetical protein